MTPRQLQSLRKRKLEAMQREELLVGLICSASVNYSFCHPEIHLHLRSLNRSPATTSWPWYMDFQNSL
jgi:hypothetical protein